MVRKYRAAERTGAAKQLLSDLYPDRHNSGTKCKLTTHIAREVHRINLEYNGALSFAQLRDKLHDEGVGDFGADTVRRWCTALGVKVVRLYLRPKLKNHHKLDRLTWCVNEVGDSNEFSPNYDVVHIGESWHFLLSGGRRVKVLPSADGAYTIPEAPSAASKRHIDKVMFIAALARPNPHFPSRKFGDEPSTGKVVMHPIVEMGEYTRGPLAGTEKVVNVSVNAEVYQGLIKNQVVPAIMREMWWHHKDSGTFMAGKPIWVQQDGASPHSAKTTQRSLAYYNTNAFFNRTGFRLKFVTQPARSPDLNICGLTFWWSNKSTMKGKRWSTRQEMINDVLQSWRDYPAADLEKGWRLLYTVYRGIMSDRGDNKYKKHGGDRKLQRQNLPPDAGCPPDLLAAAKAEVTRLSQALGFDQDSEGSSAGESDSGGESD